MMRSKATLSTVPVMNDRAIVGAILRQGFALFLAIAFQTMGGEGDYDHNWHIDAIKYELDRIEHGENHRLILTMPPRHLKTTTVTIAWIAWMPTRWSPAAPAGCAKGPSRLTAAALGKRPGDPRCVGVGGWLER